MMKFSSVLLILLCFCFINTDAYFTYSLSCQKLISIQYSRRDFQFNNMNSRSERNLKFNGKIILNNLEKILDKRPLNELELYSFLDQYQQEMGSRDILTLFDMLQKNFIILNNDRLSTIMQIFLNKPEMLSGENIYQIVRFSKVNRSRALKDQIWDLILSKVAIDILRFVHYLKFLFISDSAIYFSDETTSFVPNSAWSK